MAIRKRRKEGVLERAGKWADRNLVPDWRRAWTYWSTYGLAIIGAMPLLREQVELIRDLLPGPVYARVMVILTLATFLARLLKQGEK